MKTEIEAFYIFVGEDLFQARKQFVRSEVEGTHTALFFASDMSSF